MMSTVGSDVLDLGKAPSAATRLATEEDEADEQHFLVPRVEDPASYVRHNFGVGYGTDAHQAVKFEKGTTTLAFKFKHGVIVSVDSRCVLGLFICPQRRSEGKETRETCSHLVLSGLVVEQVHVWQLHRLWLGEEGHRDQPVSPGHDGRRCGGLPVLAGRARDGLPHARAAQQGAHQRDGRVQAAGEHHPPVPGLRPLDRQHDLRLGPQRAAAFLRRLRRHAHGRQPLLRRQWQRIRLWRAGREL
eukprot:scaffold1375_cov255-Pinguiococcus_pyrenoidosus.AAC.2